MQNPQGKIQAFFFNYYYFPWKAEKLLGARRPSPIRLLQRVSCAPIWDPRPSLFSRIRPDSQNSNPSHIFLVPPTVSYQGKQKSGVLSIYFSM